MAPSTLLVCIRLFSITPTSVSHPLSSLLFWVFVSDAHTCSKKDLSSGRVRMKGGTGKQLFDSHDTIKTINVHMQSTRTHAYSVMNI